MTILNLDHVAAPMGLFTFDKTGNTLVTEASTLNHYKLHRIYDDACDEGIAIKSEKTGRVVYFHIANEHRDFDDVLSWEFHPITEHVRKGWVDKNLKVIVFND